MGVKHKLISGRDTAAPTDLAVLRTLRQSAPRVADDLFQLPLGITGAKQSRLTLADVDDTLEADGWLYLTLTGSRAGPGAALLDTGFVSALVQQQTMGTVSTDAPAARSYTATDAALVAPLVTALLARLRGVAPSLVQSVSAPAEDRRSVLLALDGDTYQRFELRVDVAGGLRQGRLLLYLAEAAPARPDDPKPKPADRPAMEDTTLAMPTHLLAVLGRISLTLDGLARLEPGQLLPVPGARMDRTALVALDGRPVATARLGQAAGFRALRLNPMGRPPAPIDDSFMPHKPRGRDPLADVELPLEMDHGDLEDLSTEAAVAEITELAGLPVPIGGDVAGDASFDAMPAVDDVSDPS